MKNTNFKAFCHMYLEIILEKYAQPQALLKCNACKTKISKASKELSQHLIIAISNCIVFREINMLSMDNELSSIFSTSTPLSSRNCFACPPYNSSNKLCNLNYNLKN